MWHPHLSLEIAAEFASYGSAQWSLMELRPHAVRRPYRAGEQTPEDADIKRAAAAVYRARYSASESGRATIIAWRRSDRWRQSARDRDARRRGK